MIEREVKLLLDANAVKQVQVHYAIMSDGYMVVIDGKPLETGKRETREFRTLDSAANCSSRLELRIFRLSSRRAEVQ